MRKKKRRLRILNGLCLTSPLWRHPWQLTPRWSTENDQWETTIKMGLVNGIDATVQIDGADVALREAPRMPLTSFRALGPDASPAGALVSNAGEVSFSFEGVPDYFLARGVGLPPKYGGAEGVTLQDTNATAGSVRLLRALDVVLYQDRRATSSAITVDTSTVDSTVLTYNVTTFTAPNAREKAYLRTVTKYTIPPPGLDALARLTGDWADTPRDELHMATVYLMSPLGAAYFSAPDATWQAFVQHRVFWNLHHGTNQLPPPLDAKPLTLNTGLAGGVGDRINQFLLAQVNDANSATAQFLGRNTIEGIFWT